jgi:Rad3-related DNA helicase
VLRVHFDALHFCRMAEAFGPHSLFDVTQAGSAARLCIRNVSPAPFLAPRFAACATAVLFSATLSPPGFYRRLLGLPESVPWINVDSPFAEHQLDVRVERRISTRYRDRQHSLIPIAELIARQYRSQPGNYLAFFGSFDYLRAALAVFNDRFPEVATWEQVRGMDGAQRDAFLARFTPTSRGIGFAVLGGVFAEGIDLPGDRLIGAFIATLGLPRVNGVNAEIERRMQSLFDAGYEYTYLYPGLQKVVQAAGRVIRTVSDRGTVYLIDDRYMGSRVRELLPRWWRIRCS